MLQRTVARVVLLACVAGLSVAVDEASAHVSPAGSDRHGTTDSHAVSCLASSDFGASDAHAGLSRETRLRKLHLVRPDLIPYPVAYEVVC